MIYIINPENNPNTNKSIIAEPIDVLEIYEIVNQKYDAKFIDMDVDDILPSIKDNDILIFIYDYILPLHTEDTLINIEKILQLYKNNKNKILISKQCLQNYKKLFKLGFNFLIYANPENTINNLINCIIKNNYNNLKNVFLMENNNITKKDFERKNIEYIIPRRDFDLSKYNDVRTIISSIGCNNNCKFCPTPYYQGKWNSRSIKSIVKEIKYLNDLGYTKIMFLDDNFTTSKTRIDRLCNSLNQNNINCNFGFLSSINNYNYNLFKKMYKHGFKWVHFGIESGSNKILRSMQKNQSRHDILKTLKEVKKIGYKLRISLIIDYPNTDDKDIEETLSLIKKIKPNEIRLHFTAYRYLTPLFNEFKISDKQYIHNNKTTKEQEYIKNKYIEELKKVNYDIIDDFNYDWNKNNSDLVASFVPIKYGRCWT